MPGILAEGGQRTRRNPLACAQAGSLRSSGTMQVIDRLHPDADDGKPEAQLRRRTHAAAEHLRLLAARAAEHGLHLVLHPSIDECFAFEPHDLPHLRVDRRSQGDAMATALADRRSILVVGAGPWLGQPTELDRRWQLLAELHRSRATLVCSPLSGRYDGLYVDGPLAIRYEP
jgi:hypothetical protein